MEMIFHSCLSPPQRFLCVVGWLGRKKKRARGERLEGRREKRGLFPPFPCSHRPPRGFFFLDYFYFYRDIQREPLRRRELRLWQSSHANKTHVVHFIGLNLKATVFGSRKWQEVAEVCGSCLMGLVSLRFLPLTSDVALVFRYISVGDWWRKVGLFSCPSSSSSSCSFALMLSSLSFKKLCRCLSQLENVFSYCFFSILCVLNGRQTRTTSRDRRSPVGSIIGL